jgi:hypothetical protein
MGVDRYTSGSWSFSAEVAPGAQRIGSAGDFEGRAQRRARVGYTIAPGREIGLAFTFSDLGLERFAAGRARVSLPGHGAFRILGLLIIG